MSVRPVAAAPQPIAPSCLTCKKTVEKILKCSRCALANYCSKDCQVENWPLHKLVCTTPEQRAEKTASVVRENQEIINSPKFVEALAPTGLKISEKNRAENEIRRLIDTSPDKEILLQLINKVFPQITCEKKLKRAWKELSSEDRHSRIQKYNEICQMFQKLEEQRSAELRNNPMTMPIQLIKNAAQAISNLPQPSDHKLTADITLLRQAASIVVQVLPRIEASKDVETIITYSSRAVSGMVLEKDLKLRWSKLPAQEAALRNQAWQKIAPYYEAYVKAIELLQKQAYHNFVAKS